MIGGGLQEIEAAKSVIANGYRLAITDRNPNSPCREYADYFLNFDGNDSEGISEYIAKNQDKIGICGVFTLTELVITAAKVASNLGLPSVSVDSAIFCQNKAISKKYWLRDNIPTPQGRVFKNPSDATEFFHNYNEIFVKPIEGFGGIGAGKIKSIKALKAFLAVNDIEKYIIEEVCNGPMIDVNGYFDENGCFNGLGCFERTFTKDKIIESQAFYPCQREEELINEAYDLTELACKALNISWGPVKADLVLTKSGLKVFEVAPRLHGPKGTLYLAGMVHDKNHLEFILPLIAGKTIQNNENKLINKIAAFQIIDHPGSTFNKITGLNELIDLGYKVLLFKDSLEKMPKEFDSSNVIGYVFAAADLEQDLIKKLDQINRFLSFKHR